MVDAGGWAERANPDRPELRTRLFLEGMQALGLQVANVASRDLRFGPDFLELVHDSLGIELVSANVRVRGEPVCKPWVLMSREVEGGRTVRIAIAGVTAEMHGWENAWPEGDVTFDDPVGTAGKLLPALEAQSDLQVLLAALPAADLEAVAQAYPGYDVLVCGTGDLRETPPSGAAPVVLAPGTKCKFGGWVVLRLAPDHAVVVESQIPELSTKIPDDPEMARRIEALKKRLGPAPTETSAATH